MSDILKTTDLEMIEFNSRMQRSFEEQRVVAEWHRNLWVNSNGKVDLPHKHGDTYIYATKRFPSKWISEDGTEHDDWEPHCKYKQGEVDYDGTVAYLSLITKTAKSIYSNLLVEKKYDEDTFRVKFTLPISMEDGSDEKVTISYNVKREAVCKKKVTGTRHVEEHVTPAHDEEIVEWECEPVSLLGHKLDELEV